MSARSGIAQYLQVVQADGLQQDAEVLVGSPAGAADDERRPVRPLPHSAPPAAGGERRRLRLLPTPCQCHTSHISVETRTCDAHEQCLRVCSFAGVSGQMH